jgi:hypothetical protein
MPEGYRRPSDAAIEQAQKLVDAGKVSLLEGVFLAEALGDLGAQDARLAEDQGQEGTP